MNKPDGGMMRDGWGEDAVVAMVTKGTLAMIVGVKLGERLPQRTLRALASASCGLLGLLALGGILVR